MGHKEGERRITLEPVNRAVVLKTPFAGGDVREEYFGSREDALRSKEDLMRQYTKPTALLCTVAAVGFGAGITSLVDIPVDAIPDLHDATSAVGASFLIAIAYLTSLVAKTMLDLRDLHKKQIAAIKSASETMNPTEAPAAATSND